MTEISDSLAAGPRRRASVPMLDDASLANADTDEMFVKGGEFPPPDIQGLKRYIQEEQAVPDDKSKNDVILKLATFEKISNELIGFHVGQNPGEPNYEFTGVFKMLMASLMEILADPTSDVDYKKAQEYLSLLATASL